MYNFLIVFEIIFLYACEHYVEKFNDAVVLQYFVEIHASSTVGSPSPPFFCCYVGNTLLMYVRMCVLS